MRRAMILLMLPAIVLAMSSCDRKDKEEDKKAGRLTIAVIPKATMHIFWKSVEAGAKKAGKELDVEVIWKGPLREDDREDQIKVVDDMITRGVSGIVLAPLDDAALRGPVSEAMRARIPVVIFDSGLKGEAGKDYVSFVATDNEKGGLLGGQELGRALKGEGKAVMLRYSVGHASTTNREVGFLKAMKEFPKIEVVSSNQYAGTTAESAYTAAERLLEPLKTADGLTIQGIFCPNESSAFGMLRALQDGKVAGKVTYVAFDASPKLIDGLKKGHIHALVVQNPVYMGYMGVKTMVRHLRGEKVNTRIDTGVAVVTQANMDEPKIKELLYPELDKWLK